MWLHCINLHTFVLPQVFSPMSLPVSASWDPSCSWWGWVHWHVPCSFAIRILFASHCSWGYCKSPFFRISTLCLSCQSCRMVPGYCSWIMCLHLCGRGQALCCFLPAETVLFILAKLAEFQAHSRYTTNICWLEEPVTLGPRRCLISHVFIVVSFHIK